MTDILNKLYHGEIYPAEQFEPILENYKQKLKNHREQKKDFIGSLSDSMKNEFNEIMDETIDISAMEMAQVFSDGFRLGALMMVEIFGK